MTKFLILALLTFLGGSKVHAQILTLTKSDLTGLSLEKNEAFRCRSSEQEFAFELKFSTSTGPYHRVFCPDDTKRILWEKMYADLFTLVSGVPSQACILSEKCHRWGCDRTYGKTRPDVHQILVTTSSGNRIEDYRVNLQIGCYQ